MNVRCLAGYKQQWIQQTTCNCNLNSCNSNTISANGRTSTECSLLNRNGNKNRISLKVLGHSEGPFSGARKQYLAPEISQGAEEGMKTSSKCREPIKVDAVRYEAAEC